MRPAFGHISGLFRVRYAREGQMTLSEKLFSFQGRLNRQSWWLLGIAIWIALIVVQIVVATVFGVSATPSEDGEMPAIGAMSGIAGIVVGIFALAALWMYLALTAKRFHDRDKSGWWVLIGLVPGLGALWILVDCGFLAGTSGDNRFGGDPLAG